MHNKVRGKNTHHMIDLFTSQWAFPHYIIMSQFGQSMITYKSISVELYT